MEIVLFLNMKSVGIVLGGGAGGQVRTVEPEIHLETLSQLFSFSA